MTPCKKPTIALDIRILQGEDARRGMGVYTRGLVEALLRLDRKYAYVLLVASHAPEPQCDIPSGTRIMELPQAGKGDFWSQSSKARLFRALGFSRYVPADAAALKKILKRCHALLLHLFSPLHGPFNWMPVRHVPTVATVYDLIPLRLREQYLNAWPETARLRYLTRLEWVKELDWLFPISKSVRHDLSEWLRYPAARSTVIYPGCEPQYLTEPVGTGERRGILAFASMNPSKNTERFLQAYGQLTEELRAAFPLTLVAARGKACWQWLHITLDEQGVAGDATVETDMDPLGLLRLYDRSALLALPSLEEGFGLPALEAMSRGLPVLASCIPVLEEILLDNAHYFHPENIANMTETLKELLEHPEWLDRLAQKGRERAKLFDWHESAKTLEEQYAGLLSHPR